jgi:hypothetical protein
MKLVALAFLSLILISLPAAACRDNSDCKQPGTRCIQGAMAPLGNFCGPWETKDAGQVPMSVVGQDNKKVKPGQRNNAATGEVCQSDRDCPSGKKCVRPSTDSAWRCVR